MDAKCGFAFDLTLRLIPPTRQRKGAKSEAMLTFFQANENDTQRPRHDRHFDKLRVRLGREVEIESKRKNV